MHHDLSHIRFVGVEPITRDALRSEPAPALGGKAMMPQQPLAGTALNGRTDPAPLLADTFAGWVLRKAGLDERAYRSDAIRRRVPASLRKLRVGSEAEAKALLEKKPELVQVAVDSFLIGVTEFFRDRGVFEALRTEVLPELLRERKSLRIYSAGVSEGHELYSMAMLLGEAGVLDRSELLGVDCRPEAIARAQIGCFDADDFEKMEGHWRKTYFGNDPNNSGWCVKPELKERIRWCEGDLFSFSAERLWDIILFRNVAIYFDNDHASIAWERLHSQLAPGGFMITGPADRPPANLRLVRVANSIYRKTDQS